MNSRLPWKAKGMTPDPRLEAHLEACKRAERKRRQNGDWLWPDPPTPEDFQLSQATVDAVADLIAILQSIQRRAGVQARTENTYDQASSDKTKDQLRRHRGG